METSFCFFPSYEVTGFWFSDAFLRIQNWTPEELDPATQEVLPKNWRGLRISQPMENSRVVWSRNSIAEPWASSFKTSKMSFCED